MRRRRLELNRSAAGARAAYLRTAGIVAAATGLPLGEVLLTPKRGRAHPRDPVAAARWIAIYLTVVGCDVRAGALARAIGRPRTNVSRACRMMEDRRDQAAFDQWLSRLEAML